MTQAAVTIVNIGGGSIKVTNDGTSNSATSIDLNGATIEGGGTSITLNNRDKKTFYGTEITISTGGNNSLILNAGGVAYIEYCGSINIDERLRFNTDITVTGQNEVSSGTLELRNANFVLRMQSTAETSKIVNAAINAKYVIDTICPITLVVPTTERLVITGGDDGGSFSIGSDIIELPASETMSTVSYNYAKPDGENPGTGWLLSNKTDAALTYKIECGDDDAIDLGQLKTITATDLDRVYTCGVECYGLSSLTSITVGNGGTGSSDNPGIYGSNCTIIVDECSELTGITCGNGGTGMDGTSFWSGNGGKGGSGNIEISDCDALTDINCYNGGAAGTGYNTGGKGGSGSIKITNCNALTTGINCYNGGTGGTGGKGGTGGSGGSGMLTISDCSNLTDINCYTGGTGGTGTGGKGGTGGSGGSGMLTISDCSNLTDINCYTGGTGGTGTGGIAGDGGDGGNGSIIISDCDALTDINCYNAGTGGTGGSINGSGNGGSGGTLTINNCQSINTINCSNGGTDGKYAGSNGYATVILNNSFPKTVNVAYSDSIKTANTASTIIINNWLNIQKLSELNSVINTNSISKITTYYINSVTITNSDSHFQATIPANITDKLKEYEQFLNKIDSLLSNISVKSVIFDLNNGTYSYQSAKESGTFHKCSVENDKFIVNEGGYFVFNGQMFANTTGKQIEYKFEQQ